MFDVIHACVSPGVYDKMSIRWTDEMTNSALPNLLHCLFSPFILSFLLLFYVFYIMSLFM